MIQKSNNTKLKTYGLLIGLFLAISLGLSLLTAVIAYPTAGHKQVAAEFTTLNNSAFTGGDLTVVDSPRYKELVAHPNTVYSDRVNNISTVVQLLIWLAAIVFAYRYLRKYRLVKNPTWTLAFVNAIVAALTIIPVDLFLREHAGVSSTFGFEFPLGLFMLGFTCLFTLFVTWLIAKIVEWQYNRSHGFIEE